MLTGTIKTLLVENRFYSHQMRNQRKYVMQSLQAF